MHYTQINLHKAKLAAIDLHDKLQAGHDIALLTEPYLYNNKIVGLPKGYKVLLPTPDDTEEIKPIRTGILLPQHYGVVQLESHSNPDCTAAILTTKTCLLYTSDAADE